MFGGLGCFSMVFTYGLKVLFAFWFLKVLFWFNFVLAVIILQEQKPGQMAGSSNDQEPEKLLVCWQVLKVAKLSCSVNL